ncbi:hypothetical protein ANN_19268 [Periplaneta americana]|uniref:Uncharacterized protein n=1 Tax=Periplaneta americana TaxID=6978 RepID=A0ABQ8S9E3_PERAM|nr:hypothetical protein ANN_19268 [Periplaneta americana]
MTACTSTMSVRVKQRAVIELLTAENMPPIDIHQRLKAVYRDQCVDISSVRRLSARTRNEPGATLNLCDKGRRFFLGYLATLYQLLGFFSVDEIGGSEMGFGEMRSRIRHSLPDIRLTVGENLGNNPNSRASGQLQILGVYYKHNMCCCQEVKRRIALAKEAFNRKRSIFCEPLEKELRKRLVKCFVWCVELYGEETWTLRRSEEKRIEAFEMWIWRRMERVKWTDIIRNEAVLKRVGKERMMLKLTRKRKRNWLGHWLRRNCLFKDALEGNSEWKKS